MTYLTYIGVGVSPWACSVITTIRSVDNPGTYAIAKIWNSDLMTYKGINKAIIDALKISEWTNEYVNNLTTEFQKTNNEL